jgi:crotonobetainyl-CoA:carnitine CoA-transferase CaiB-like acyl-CoA transferase
MGASESLGGIFLRDLTGMGLHIDLSTHEAVAFNLMRDIGSYTYDGILPGRAKGQVRVFGHFVPCADGYVQLYVTDDRQWQNFVEVMGNPDWARDERFATTLSRIAHAQILDEHIAAWTKNQRKEDIYHAVQARHTACGPVNTMDEVLASPQLAARGFFTQVDHPDTGPLTYPGAPCELSRTPFLVARPAPRLGEHNEEVFCGRLGVSREDLVRLRACGAV